MNAIEIGKRIMDIATTAGIKKDTVDLLTAQVRVVTDELALARKRIAQLEIENGQLHAQIDNLHPVGFQESMGVLWKRMGSGFEPHPYCKECSNHPVMAENPPNRPYGVWVCSQGHHAPKSVKPPAH